MKKLLTSLLLSIPVSLLTMEEDVQQILQKLNKFETFKRLQHYAFQHVLTKEEQNILANNTAQATDEVKEIIRKLAYGMIDCAETEKLIPFATQELKEAKYKDSLEKYNAMKNPNQEIAVTDEITARQKGFKMLDATAQLKLYKDAYLADRQGALEVVRQMGINTYKVLKDHNMLKKYADNKCEEEYVKDFIEFKKAEFKKLYETQ